MFQDLQDAWRSVAELQFEHVGHEVNPAMANAIGPDDVVVVSSFQIDLEGGTGDLHITMPYAMLEPLREQLVSGVQANEEQGDERWLKALRRDIMMATLELDLTVAERELTLRDVMQLEAGDVIPVEMPETLELRANGVPMFKCQLGTSRGNLAVKIKEPIKQPEDE
jgi:flagellar motor switch protein FliM